MTSDSPIRRPALRIVVFADSISLPRIEQAGRLRWEESWPSQLEAGLRLAGLDVEVLNRGARNRHSYDLGGEEFLENVTYTEPDVVMLQVGVNDCAPRLFTLRGKARINRWWFPRWIRNRIIRYHSKHRVRILGRDPYRKVHTTPEAFRANVATFMDRLREEHPDCRLVCLPIMMDPVVTDAKSPGFSDNSYRYNEILRDLAGARGYAYAELERCLPDEQRVGGTSFFPDGFHLHAEASGLVARELARVVRGLEEGRAGDP